MVTCCSLAELLLLESANLLNVHRVELRAAFLLIGGELLVVEGLEANGGLANTDDNHTAALWPALVVLLVGEGDVNLGNVVGGVGRRSGVGKHGRGAIVEDNDALSAVAGFDGETSVVARLLDIMVLGEGLVQHLLLPPHPPHQHQKGESQQAAKSKSEKCDEDIDGCLVVAGVETPADDVCE